MKNCDSFWLLLQYNNLFSHLTVYFNYLFIFALPLLRQDKIQFYFSVIILIYHSSLFSGGQSLFFVLVDYDAINSGCYRFISLRININPDDNYIRHFYHSEHISSRWFTLRSHQCGVSQLRNALLAATLHKK
ncbi:hypothetical protein WCU73_14050 [Pectobacterium brasiliense]|uniref:hypothetical protein n=1 Tax=Pectobacterium brasiliense TaxID=180957 RepID=UPI00301B019D